MSCNVIYVLQCWDEFSVQETGESRLDLIPLVLLFKNPVFHPKPQYRRLIITHGDEV